MNPFFRNWVGAPNSGPYIQTYEPAVNELGLTDARQKISDRNDYFVFGRAGDDIIRSSAGNDTIFAGAGNDWIDGGPGNDVIWGCAGADIFRFDVLEASPGSQTASGGVGAGSRDVVRDWQAGLDKLDVSGWQAEQYGTGEAVFVGQGQLGAVGLDLMVFFQHEGGNTVVTLARQAFPGAPGTDGPMLHAEIELTGIHTLAESDFIW